MAGKLKYDLTGQKIGRLTVLSRTEHKDRPRWNCVCDCGKEIVLPTEQLRNGTKSCGCYRSEWAKGKSTKHGSCKRSGRDRLYGVWNMMKQRCVNPNNAAYKNYGGRGITVCEEWQKSYKSFMDWAVENGYDKDAKHGECTIDRIDNNKGYSPDNCRFVSSKEQARNTRTNRLITFCGETKTLADWGDKTGINPTTIQFRLKSGWTLEEALKTKPIIGRNQKWQKV